MVLVDSRGEQVEIDCRNDVYKLEADVAYEKWYQLRTNQDKSYFLEQNP